MKKLSQGLSSFYNRLATSPNLMITKTTKKTIEKTDLLDSLIKKYVGEIKISRNSIKINLLIQEIKEKKNLYYLGKLHVLFIICHLSIHFPKPIYQMVVEFLNGLVFLKEFKTNFNMIHDIEYIQCRRESKDSNATPLMAALTLKSGECEFERISDQYLSVHVTPIVYCDHQLSLNLAKRLLELHDRETKDKISDHIFTFHSSDHLFQATHLFSAYLKIDKINGNWHYKWLIFYVSADSQFKKKIDLILQDILKKLRDVKKLEEFCLETFKDNTGIYANIFCPDIVENTFYFLNTCATKNKPLHDRILSQYGHQISEQDIKEAIQQKNYNYRGKPVLFRKFPVQGKNCIYASDPDDDSPLPPLEEEFTV
jgi:hypothetical protein